MHRAQGPVHLRLGSLAFFLWFTPALALLYAVIFPRGKSRWPWLLILSAAFLASRGYGALLFAVALTAFVCKAAQGLNGNTFRFWLSLGVCLAAWFAAHQYTNLGISPSYLTFFLLAYLIEVYWGRLPALRSYGQFAAVATSLSYISAGPVPAPQTQTRQVLEPHKLNGVLIREALLRIVTGLTKKAIADAIFQWSAAIQSGEGGGAVHAWSLELLRAARVYADFSGYADLAIGAGLLLGHRLPEDFRLPFLSTSVSSYWRSWNASISAFFIHYVFTPLTLSLRRGPAWFAVLISTYVTLCLSGLWHGFTANQLAWGLLVGTMILLEGGLRLQVRLRDLPGGTLASWFITFYVMCLARVFSLEESWPAAWSTLTALHSGFGEGWRPRFLKNLAWAVLAIVVPHAFDWLRSRDPRLYKSPLRWACVVSGLLFVMWFFSDGGMPFVYEGY